jgi:hypothetical protein
LSPVEAQISALVEDARRAGGLTAGALVGLLGNASYPMVVLALSMLNMIPGPPGYGGTLALAIMAVTVTRLLGQRLHLGGWVGARKLPPRLLDQMLRQLHWLAGLIARVSRPRLEALTGPQTETAVAVFILLVSLPMVLPIPFINAVPNTGIAVICVSRVNRDGLGVLIGAVIALVGLGIAAGAIWAAIHLAGTLMA